MNKYQEAFEDLCVTWDEEGMGKDHLQNQYPHLYNTIKELVDKETPMKPIVYNLNQFKCPKCKKQIKGQKMLYNMETKRFDKKCDWKCRKVYCPYCGQKLDWSDTND